MQDVPMEGCPENLQAIATSAIEAGQSESEVAEMLRKQADALDAMAHFSAHAHEYGPGPQVHQRLSRDIDTTRARLRIRSGEEDATVYLFRDAARFANSTLPPSEADLTCSTPCEVDLDQITPEGFALYLGGDVFGTPTLSRRDLSFKGTEDGMPIYEADIDMRKMSLFLLHLETEAEFPLPEKCEDPRRDFLTDADASPCHRVPAAPPPDASGSGSCRIKFDVSPFGRVKNLDVTSCTHDVFHDSTRLAAIRWRYYPKLEDGVPVWREGMVSQMTFRMSDEDGNLLPDQAN